LTPSGHHPIPDTGTRVRAYLKKDDGSWNVVLPNGLTPVDGTLQTDGALQDAAQVAQLRNRARAYTLLLPLEIWALLIIAGIPVLAIIRKSRKRRSKDDAVNR
jgi:hypothetical protein